MITINSLNLDGIIFMGIHLELPYTNLFIIMNEMGFIMSTTLHLEFFPDFSNERKLIAAVMPEVNQIDDLLQAPIEKLTEDAKKIGWFVGMKGKDALLTIV